MNYGFYLARERDSEQRRDRVPDLLELFVLINAKFKPIGKSL